MCGIVGQWNRTASVNATLFDAMRDTLTHRGPDGFGTHLTNDQLLALGHRRLSFLDLGENGQQPLSNEDGTIWTTFNGEIYNYLELRAELKDRGHVFKSQSDTEVLVHGYEEWGSNLPSKLKGMFAFAIWDERKKQLFLVRDRFGIKPLYYYQDSNSFAFASEIKALKKNTEFSFSLSNQSICDYLAYRYVPSPNTIWSEVKKLPPAHYMLIDEAGIQKTHQYWSLSSSDKKTNRKELVDEMAGRLEASVRQHLQSDVPVGSFLSGGYDSSALVYLMSKLGYHSRTFSVGFDGWDKSEHQYAEVVADRFGMDHHSKILDEGGLALLDRLSYVYDEPIADISIIPTYAVSQMAASNVKAVLSGEGADELFGGYTWQHDHMSNLASQSNMQRIAEKLNLRSSIDKVEYYGQSMAMGRFNQESLPEILHKNVLEALPNDSEWFYRQNFNHALSPLKSIQQMDIKCFMGELVLTKIDRASMANSLEVRVPFLDHELFEVLFKYKEATYYEAGTQKVILKSIIKDVMPKQILGRKKQGFVGPDSFYQNIGWYERELTGGMLVQNHIITDIGLRNLINQKQHWHLWKLLVLEKWYRQWM
jgi:asparagine synthase (glutamine-hydrolysing)